MTNAAGQHLPAWAGGQATKQSETQGARDGESRTGGRLRNAANLAGAAAAAGATAGARAAAGGTAGATAAAGTSSSGAAAGRAANGRAYTPPPTAQAQVSGRGLQNGLQTPSFAGREQDFANEQFEAGFRARTSPVSGAQAREALRSLPEDTRRGVRQLVSDHGAGAREHLAYQAMGEWTPDEREALRTLAAASPGRARRGHPRRARPRRSRRRARADGRKRTEPDGRPRAVRRRDHRRRARATPAGGRAA